MSPTSPVSRVARHGHRRGSGCRLCLPVCYAPALIWPAAER
ncbi:MAG: hypothetical protein HW375_2405, partial [Anaerolineales bacterium]|nr:hypothetical protein [Anaerolineales bacterium]